MKRMLAILVLMIPLAGCIPAAFVAGAAAGGAVIYDKRSMKTMLEDGKISNLAQSRINQDPQLKGRSHISVAAFDHIVLMVGQAQTPELKQRAYQIVASVPDIKRIYNEVQIEGSISYLQRSSDDWITTKVKSRMLATPGLNSTQIKVVTEAGVVYLMGEVSQSQGNLAADAARRVGGVVKVVKVFEYSD